MEHVYRRSLGLLAPRIGLYKLYAHKTTDTHTHTHTRESYIFGALSGLDCTSPLNPSKVPNK